MPRRLRNPLDQKTDLAALRRSLPDAHHQDDTSVTDGRSGYMAASQRSPLIKDQWRSESDRHHRTGHRDRDPADRPPRPNGSRHADYERPDDRSRQSVAVESQHSLRHEREHSRGRRGNYERSHHGSPRRVGHGEGPERDRAYRERRHDYDYDEYPSRRDYSPHKSSRHYSEYYRERERSPGHDRTVHPEYYKERDYPSHSSHHSYYDYPSYPHYHERERERERPERYAYPPSYNRERGRPRHPEHYRHDYPAQRSPVPERHRGDYEAQRHGSERRLSSRRGSDSKVRDNSSNSRSRHSEGRGTSPPPKLSKSSRRSEKQKQRTLNHLRARGKAKEFLDKLSQSPRREDSGSEDQKDQQDRSMQQSTRPIQSILDDQSRRPSPPRRVPNYDENQSLHDAQVREQFPLSGMKVSDIVPI
jgi:CTD kinase subunit alpha